MDHIGAKQQFLVRFWGVRGSYPTPGPETLRHGGNTSCVEVQVGGRQLIFDAGSGIIRLGNALMKRPKDEPLAVSLFITHGHGDHLIGFPFFSPLFSANTTMHLFGPQLSGQSIEQLVTPLMSPPYFPVEIQRLPSHRTFHTILKEECITWQRGQTEPTLHGDKHAPLAEGALRVLARFTYSHPLDGALMYRVEYGGHNLVYATDVEWSEGCEADFLTFAEGADVLIHDAQYTTHDYQQVKHGYGHSTIEMAVEAARSAHVSRLILFHHEPAYDDDQLDRMEAEAQKHFAQTYSSYEGMEIDLLA